MSTRRQWKSLVVAFLFCMVVFILLPIGVDAMKKPDFELFMKGRVYGSFADIFRAQYSFSTFDRDGNLMRNEKIDIFLFRNFYLEFLEGEVSARIYVSSSSSKNKSPSAWEVSEISPELLTVKDVSGQRIRFIQNTYLVFR